MLDNFNKNYITVFARNFSYPLQFFTYWSFKYSLQINGKTPGYSEDGDSIHSSTR